MSKIDLEALIIEGNRQRQLISQKGWTLEKELLCFKDQSTLTIATIKSQLGDPIYIGFSCCSPKDEFRRTYGDVVATGRALKAGLRNCNVKVIEFKPQHLDNLSVMWVLAVCGYLGLCKPTADLVFRRLQEFLPGKSKGKKSLK